MILINSLEERIKIGPIDLKEATLGDLINGGIKAVVEEGKIKFYPASNVNNKKIKNNF